MPIRLNPLRNELELRRCPRCRGRVLARPMALKQDAVCGMCAGGGWISDLKCSCGRPVIWRFGDHASCNFWECQDAAFLLYGKDKDALSKT